MIATRSDRFGWYLAYSVAAVFTAVLLCLFILRLIYPHELEWMEGAMMDHSVRILEGKPIYTAPSIDFVAWLYPPLYYYAVAAVMKVVGISWFAGRIISFISTLATGALISLIVHKCTGRRAFAWLSFLLYLASYRATGYYFDVVRNDAFFTAMLMIGAFSAAKSDTWRGAALTGALFAAAFFTKQQAIFFLPPVTIWFWLRNRTLALIFSATSIALALIVYLVFEGATHGWLGYYLFAIPNAKRVDFRWQRAFTLFPDYLFGTFTICSLALAVLVGTIRSGKANWQSTDGLMILLSCAAIAAGALSIGNLGGYKNVMMPFAAFTIPLLPIAIHRLSQTYPPIETIAPYLFVFQFLAFSMNPFAEKMLIASPKQRRGADEFIAKLRSIPGEVFIPYHGYVAREAGKASHAHVLATMDVLKMEDSTSLRLQRDFSEAYHSHRFSAIIEDESKAVDRDSVQGYSQAGLMLREPNVGLTRLADDVTRPQYLYVPVK